MATANFTNRTLFHGDNLLFLRGLNSDTIDLIATDPPFKKGRDFHATPNSLAAGARFEDRWSWERDVHTPWVDQIKDDWPGVWAVIAAARQASGDDMAAYLAWLGVRLLECHRLLKPTGSLYLHIDHTAHAYVKLLLDAIFGPAQFRNEIVWCYRGGGVPKNAFARKHDTILFYSKSDRTCFTKQYVPYSAASQKLVRSRGGVSIDGKQRDLARGAAMPDWWTEPNALQTWSPERTGYPTQKPLALLERIIKASSNKGELVLDPFCGCATTPVAAERLGRQWIGMDLWDQAYEVVLTRLKAYGFAVSADEGEQPTQRGITNIGAVGYVTTPPERTDENEVAAPVLRLKLQRPKEKWQTLSHSQIVMHLTQAQSLTQDDQVVCAGCGRQLEREFMELDHIQPRRDGGVNDISNRVLLCRPCNGRKAASLTMTGLVRENRKVGWLRDERVARQAQERAQLWAQLVQDSPDPTLGIIGA